MNLADLPWRPMDSVPNDGSKIVVAAFGQNGEKPIIAHLEGWFGGKFAPVSGKSSRPWANGWLTLAEFNKLVNGEDAGI